MNDLVKRFEMRIAFLKDYLQQLPQTIQSQLPVPVSDILTKLHAVNEAKYIEDLQGNFETTEIIEREDDEWEDDTEDEAGDWDRENLSLCFHYYYDGSESPREADGVLYEKCKNPFHYSETDLACLDKCPGVESDAKFFGKDKEGFPVDINPYLGPCHDVLINFGGLDDDIIIDDVDITYIIEALFQTKMYLAINKAFERDTGKEAKYIFLQIHGRWPVLVAYT